MSSDRFKAVEIPHNLFAVLDAVLFKVLLFLYVIGECKKGTEDEDIEGDCYTEIEIDYLGRLLNLDEDTLVDALARLIEEGFIIIRENDETKEMDKLISFWIDYQVIDGYEGIPEEDVLYTDDLKIELYPKERANVTDYLMQFQDE